MDLNANITMPSGRGISKAAQAKALKQAAKDDELMQQLNERAELAKLQRIAAEAPPEEPRLTHRERIQKAQSDAIIAALREVPVNRAQRRQQTKAFAKALLLASRAEAPAPEPEPTIIPKSKRRRR